MTIQMETIPRSILFRAFMIFTMIGLLLLWIQIKLPTPVKPRNWYWDGISNYSNITKHVFTLVPKRLHKFLLDSYSNNTNITSNETLTDWLDPSVSDILQRIQVYNDAQMIYNEDKFGPVQNDTIIIAIQMHKRLTYLRYLIVSLAQARNIERTLLIFSHDHYDEAINALVRSIDFAMVMQIFYPYSLQTHQNIFPGMDYNDCPENITYQEAVRLKCNNANHPDVHGHYRDPKFTQTKHHWWWKANRIFNQLQVTDGHTGMVLFLEEDHYVTEDFLYMLGLLKKTADVKCPECELLCLGPYSKFFRYRNESFSMAEISPWHPTEHNMGFAFNRSVWDHIMSLQHDFCAHDDYNWDYSLLHLSRSEARGRRNFKVLMSKGPRVFHIGKCGTHHRWFRCNPSITLYKAERLLRRVRKLLFPAQLEVIVYDGGSKANRTAAVNGGWADVRDQQLCTNMTKEGRGIRIVRRYLLRKFDELTKSIG